MTANEKTNPNRTARVAGILLLIMVVASLFSTGFVRVTLIVPGDATATANNISASESQFRSGIVGHLVVLVTDVGVSFHICRCAHLIFVYICFGRLGSDCRLIESLEYEPYS